MKRVEVFHAIYDTLADPDHSTNIQYMIRTWLYTSEEGMFILQHSNKPVDIIQFENPYTLCSMVVLHAFLDEKIETFWRLKFK